MECFIDEVAYTAKVDPLTYRLNLLSMPIHPKETYSEENILTLEKDRALARHVLELAADKAGWGSKSNLGIALGKFNSHCAQVAEVEIERNKLVVKKITVAIHCSTAVNPLLIENQLQGAVVFGMQALFYGGITIKNGRIEQSNFHNYKMPRMDEVPEISVHIVPSSDPPKGVGEPGVPPLAPAVLNAFYSLTHKRIRNIPLPNKELAG